MERRESAMREGWLQPADRAPEGPEPFRFEQEKTIWQRR
jgi:hypothetical protein